MAKEKIESVLERVRNWPEQRQEEAARMLEAMEHSGTGVYRLSPEERASVLEGLAEAERGEFVSDKDMEDFWNRHQK